MRSMWVLCTVLLAGQLWAQDAKETLDPALERFYTANALYNRKLYAAAIPEYREFLKQSPQHAKADQARLGLALSCYLTDNLAEAEPLLRSLTEAGKVGDQAQLLVCLGLCQLKVRTAADAEKTFASVAQANGAEEHKRVALSQLTDARFRQAKWTETIAAADAALKVMADGPLANRTAYQGAFARYSLKKFAEAAGVLEALLPMVKDSAMEPQVAFLLAESRRESGDLAGAATAYAVAGKNEKHELATEAAFRWGYVCFQLKQYDDAIRELSRSLRLDPKAAYVDEARCYLGRAHLEKKEFAPAAAHLRQVAQGAGNSMPVAVLWLGRTLARQGKLQETVQAITEFLPRIKKGEPALGDVLFEQANALIELKQYAEAATVLSRLEQECPNWPDLAEALRLNALCLHWEGKYAASLQRCERLIALTNAPPAATLFLRAENTFLLGPKNTDAALPLYEQVVKAAPQDPKADAARLRLAQIHQQRGAWAEVLKVLAPLVQKPPADKAFRQVNFLAGDAAYRLEDWDTAITRLQDFVKTVPKGEPNVDTALMELALAGARKNKTADSKEALAALVSQHKQSQHLALALVEEGKLQYENKRAREARQSFQRIVAEFPNSPQRPQAEYYLGWIDLDEKQDEAARQHFEYVVTKSPKDPVAADSLLQLGLLTLKADKFTEAYGFLRRHTQEHPNSPKADEALYAAGVALARGQEAGQAILCFRALREKFPKSPLMDRALYEWAWAERNQNKQAGAIKQYELLLQEFPQSPLAERSRFELSELTFDAKNFDAVIAQLQESIRTAKEPVVKEQAMYKLAWAYLSKNDPENAAQTFESFVATFPNADTVATAHYQAGECRMRLKEYDAALRSFTAAVKARKTGEVHESALLRLGEAQALMLKWADSVATYRQYQTTYPAGKWLQHARLGAGWAFENQKQYRDAINEYSLVVATKNVDETAARCQFQIGECLFAQGKHDQAIQELTRVEVTYRYKDWSARALLEIGRVLEAKGDKAGAVARFKEVISRFPANTAALVAKERLDALRATM